MKTPASRGSPAQLALELPQRPAQGAEDFLVSRANAAAVDLIDAWPAWEAPALLVVGPAGAGKSHLASVWRLKSAAASLPGAMLGEASISVFEAAHALVVEDIDRGIGDERVLFHLLNLARERGYALLITSRFPPGDLEIALPDLRSRLRALPLAVIEPPDEALLRAVLVKLFADRQLAVEPRLVAYIALHMERSMEAAGRVVAAVDRLSLAAHRKVTRSIAAAALASLAERSGHE